MKAIPVSGDYCLKARQVFTADGMKDNAYVHISNGHIESIGFELDPRYQLIDLGDRKLLPGLIDLHIHGQSGADAMDATPESLATIARDLPKNGVTGFLATTVTAPWEKILAALANIRECMGQDTNQKGAELLGSYLEGPFFTPKHKGAHPEQHFLSPSAQRIDELIEVAGDSLKVAALAPESEGAVTATERLKANHVRVALGHSDATFEQATACIDAGASIAVHLYNGMSGLHHREPGCVGAFLASDSVTTEMIADGVHVHPAALKLSWKCKGTDKSVLITDCMCAGGLPDGEYQLGELPVTVIDGVARTRCGSLAGSTLPMNKAIRNMVALAGVPEADAIKMATEVPAKLLGIDNRVGVIAPGREASLIVTDNDYNVELTLMKGQPIYPEQRESK
ncbi:N-acetylglucosamine-6-phosphate deacetylase [Endozoicomonas lisbonensis]|uniref:N-acetylgalactosamine-6-phosphate deacetylase n=1 Tax=Endozoicomonas lisbonensis TaxID=3120522 RepID=A0ABV2SB05_9GAMM